MTASGGASSGGGSSCPVYTSSARPPGVTEILGESGVNVVALVGGQIFYLDPIEDKLFKMPASGGTPAEVATIKGYPVLRGDDLLLWWERDSGTQTSRLLSAPLSNPATTTEVVTGVGDPESLDADGTHAYYGTAQPANILRVSLSGGAPEVLVPGGHPLGSVLQGGFLYWLDFSSKSLERVPVAGGARERLTGVHHGGPMAADAAGVYWADTSLKAIEKWSQATGRVRLASADPGAFTLGDGVLYWGDGRINPSLRSINTDGTGASSILCRLNSIGNIVLDGPDLVFSAGLHGILRVRR